MDLYWIKHKILTLKTQFHANDATQTTQIVVLTTQIGTTTTTMATEVSTTQIGTTTLKDATTDTPTLRSYPTTIHLTNGVNSLMLKRKESERTAVNVHNNTRTKVGTHTVHK